MGRKTLSPDKMWSVKPGTLVVTIPQWIHLEQTVKAIHIDYGPKNSNSNCKKEVVPNDEKREIELKPIAE